MLVEAVFRDEPQLGLNAVEEPVKHDLLAYIGIVRREHVQGKAEPPQPAPGDRAVRETRSAGWRPLRLRLACGTRSGRLVNDYHRTTERHTPQPARVSLAELRGFFKIAFSELWFDLRLGRCCGAEQREHREHRESVEKGPNLHRPLPFLYPSVQARWDFDFKWDLLSIQCVVAKKQWSACRFFGSPNDYLITGLVMD